MKKKILKILFVFIGFVFLLNIIIILGNQMQKMNHKEDSIIESKKVQSIKCTMTDKDSIDHSIELLFQDNQLITKIEEISWEDKESGTCEYYTKRAGVYNELSGISDTVNCNGSSGNRRTVYTIRELNTQEANIAELKYIIGDTSFNFDGYIVFRQNSGYHCTEN